MKELQDIVAACEQIKRCGKTAAIATVVKVSGSTYRRPSARMLMTPDGAIVGSISGGCLERDVFEHALRVLDSGEPTLVTYDTTSDDDSIWGLRLGCNGMVQVLIEPLPEDSALNPMTFLAECFHRQQIGVLVTVLRVEGQVRAKVGSRLMLRPDGTVVGNITDDILETGIVYDAQVTQSLGQSRVKLYQLSAGTAEVFIEVIQPPVSLVIFGAGNDAMPVVRFAKELGWYVTVVDSRQTYITKERFLSADAVILSRPESVHEHLRIDNRTVAVVMTHNYLHDLELLKTLLPSAWRYLGVLGPKKRTEKLLQELREQGIKTTCEQLSHLYSPVGLDIGADTPEAIALAILAEIQAVLANRSGGLLRNRQAPIHDWSD